MSKEYQIQATGMKRRKIQINMYTRQIRKRQQSTPTCT